MFKKLILSYHNYYSNISIIMSDEFTKLINGITILTELNDNNYNPDKILMDQFKSIFGHGSHNIKPILNKLFFELNSPKEILFILRKMSDRRLKQYRSIFRGKHLIILKEYFENIQKNRILKCSSIEETLIYFKQFNTHHYCQNECASLNILYLHKINTGYNTETNCCLNKCNNCVIQQRLDIKSREIEGLYKENIELKREIDVLKEIMKDEINNYYIFKKMEKEKAKEVAKDSAYIACLCVKELKLKMLMY